MNTTTYYAVDTKNGEIKQIGTQANFAFTFLAARHTVKDPECVLTEYQIGLLTGLAMVRGPNDSIFLHGIPNNSGGKNSDTNGLYLGHPVMVRFGKENPLGNKTNEQVFLESVGYTHPDFRYVELNDKTLSMLEQFKQHFVVEPKEETAA